MDTATITSLADARQKKERMEAYHIAESVLDIYESVFPDDLRLRMTMPGAYDYVTGLINEKQLAEHRNLAQAVLDDVGILASQADTESAWVLHPAVMAAYAIAMALDPEINMSEIHHKAGEAFKYAPQKKA